MKNAGVLVRLDPNAIRETIGNQELKRWWVAEQAGIHRTTLRRWLSGGIQRVRPEHVSMLARVLNVDPTIIAEPAIVNAPLQSA